MVFAIARELHVPVRFIGTGEKIDDLSEFDPSAFVDALTQGTAGQGAAASAAPRPPASPTSAGP